MGIFSDLLVSCLQDSDWNHNQNRSWVEIRDKSVHHAIQTSTSRLPVFQKREQEQKVEQAVIQASQMAESANDLNRAQTYPS